MVTHINIMYKCTIVKNCFTSFSLGLKQLYLYGILWTSIKCTDLDSSQNPFPGLFYSLKTKIFRL